MPPLRSGRVPDVGDALAFPLNIPYFTFMLYHYKHHYTRTCVTQKSVSSLDVAEGFGAKGGGGGGRRAEYVAWCGGLRVHICLKTISTEFSMLQTAFRLGGGGAGGGENELEPPAFKMSLHKERETRGQPAHESD